MNFALIAPEIAMLAAAVAVLLLDLVTRRKTLLAGVALGSLLAPAAAIWMLAGQRGSFGGALSVDNFSLLFKAVFVGIALLGLLMSIDYAKRFPRFRGEFYALTLIACAGMMLLSSATDLVMMFVALETMSIAFYALCGFLRDAKSTESSMKYLLLGGLSSAILVYGFALIYALTGTTSYAGIAEALTQLSPASVPLLLLAVSLVIAGLGFKIAAAPFQLWAPDVYEGAPTPVAALLSVGSKAAAFAALLRIFYGAFPGIPVDWGSIYALLAVLTMTVGNVAALLQSNVKRMLAYSSVAQAGYLLVGVASVSSFGRSGVIFYLISYALTNLGCFAVIAAASGTLKSDDVQDYAGLAQRAPTLAAALAFCLVSLTGLPPTAGFLAKLFVFSAAAERGLTFLVVAGVLNSALSAFYYLRVVRAAYLLPATVDSPVPVARTTVAAIALACLGILAVFFLNTPLFGLADLAARALVP